MLQVQGLGSRALGFGFYGLGLRKLSGHFFRSFAEFCQKGVCQNDSLKEPCTFRILGIGLRFWNREGSFV